MQIGAFRPRGGAATRRVATLLIALAAAPGCAPSGPPEELSRHGFFTGEVRAHVPAEGVVPYELAVEPFADFSVRRRFIALPEEGTIGYEPTAPWTFPDGTALIQSFAFLADRRDPAAGERLVETRLLLREEGAWTGLVYLWNDAQTEAVLAPAGARVDVSWIDLDGSERTLSWRVPNVAQCAICHGEGIDPVAVRTRFLNHERDYGAGLVNQLDYLEGLGAFAAPLPPAGERESLPDPFDVTAPVEARARTYLDANCAHCHRTTGGAAFSGLLLGLEIVNPVDYGVCRTPNSAGKGSGGFEYDIVPGQSWASILPFRMQTTDPNIHMPEQGASLVDFDGVALTYEWIDAMDPPGCP